MCYLYSGFIHKRTHEIIMADPASHSRTAELLGIGGDQLRELSEWEWKFGADRPEVRTHHDGHSAEKRLANALIARFKTRDGIAEPMREAAAKHNITLITALDQLRDLKKCQELVIALSGEVSAPALQKVSGSLDASAATSFSAPALQKVSGYLDARAATSFSAPALQKVSGYLYARAATSFSAPALQKVSGYLDASAATSFSAPALKECGYLYARAAVKESINLQRPLQAVKGK